MNNKIEYYCTTCKSIVGENDTVCNKCGADLTVEIYVSGWARFKEKIISFINKFGKRHRITFYLFLGPLLMFVASILLGILGFAYNEFIRDTVESLKITYIFDYFTYLLTTMIYILPIFVFTHLYLDVRLKKKIIITIAIIAILFISEILYNYFDINSAGNILLSIIFLELAFIKYSKKDFKILAVTSILFIGWFQFLSIGTLPGNMVIKDYKNITKPMNVIKSKLYYVSSAEGKRKHDMSITYLIVTKKDTQKLILNYDIVRGNGIPSQHWKLADWKIDTVFGVIMYYPKSKI